MNKKEEKKVVVWLDHSQARLFTQNGGGIISETITSAYESQPRTQGEGADNTTFGIGSFGIGIVSNNENRKNNKLQGELQSFYKGLENKLLNFHKINLIGPSTAKKELYNILKENKHFKNKKIMLESAEKLTENQLMAVVKKYLVS